MRRKTAWRIPWEASGPGLSEMHVTSAHVQFPRAFPGHSRLPAAVKAEKYGLLRAGGTRDIVSATRGEG